MSTRQQALPHCCTCVNARLQPPGLHMNGKNSILAENNIKNNPLPSTHPNGKWAVGRIYTTA